MTQERTIGGLAKARAVSALAAAGLDPSVPIERASSVTNEVWLTTDHAIRVNRRFDQRLRREAALAPYLPEAIGYPEIVKYGTGAGFDYLVQRRSAGRVLARAWPSLSVEQRQAAVQRIATMLRALHSTPCPPDLAAPEQAPHLVRAVPGRRAVAPLLDALAQVQSLPFIDPELLATLITFVKATADVLEPFSTETLIHGDLTFENVLWDGERVTSLIDFEWARGAPRDLELDVLLRFCAYPALHVAPDYEAITLAKDYEDVPFWLKESYPELFDGPDMLDRARLFSIAFDVRELLLSPPTRPLRELSEHHPLRRLSRTINQRSHLERFAFPEHFI